MYDLHISVFHSFHYIITIKAFIYLKEKTNINALLTNCKLH